MIDITELLNKLIPAAQAAIGDDIGIVAVREDGQARVLALGERLGFHTRPGALLARVLPFMETQHVVIVSFRGGGRQPHRHDREAAQRLRAAANLIDVPLDCIYLVVRGGHIHNLEE